MIIDTAPVDFGAPAAGAHGSAELIKTTHLKKRLFRSIRPRFTLPLKRLFICLSRCCHGSKSELLRHQTQLQLCSSALQVSERESVPVPLHARNISRCAVGWFGVQFYIYIHARFFCREQPCLLSAVDYFLLFLQDCPFSDVEKQTDIHNTHCLIRISPVCFAKSLS